MDERRSSGFALVELVVVVALIGALVALGMPLMNGWLADQRLKQAARGVADAFQLARAEAIRTGNNHIVYFQLLGGTDIAGNAIEDGAGQPVPVLILDDGMPAAANCQIDPGEPTRTLPFIRDVGWGATTAAAAAPLDFGAAAFATGATFADPGGNPINGVLFRPDGIPVAFDNACTLGQTGSGGGGIYVTNNNLDYAVSLSPLGQARVHAWNSGAAAWTD